MTLQFESRRAGALLAALAALAALAMAPAAHACSDGQAHAADRKQAERDAWFLRQLQRTDGDVDPRVPQLPVAHAQTQTQAQR